MNAHHTPERERPTWARTIHDLGDDLNWAISGWCDFPRPVRRCTAAVVAAAGSQLVGVNDLVASLAQVIVD